MPGGRKNNRNQGLKKTNNNAAPVQQQEPAPALKELEVRSTVLAKRKYKLTLDDGQIVQQEFDVTYGNLLLPIIEGKGPVPLKKEKYMQILNDFLDSPEGQEYRRPSAEEIEMATNQVRSEIEAYKASMRGTKVIGNEPTQTEPEQQTETPVVQPQPAVEPVTVQPQPQPQPVRQEPDPALVAAQQELARQNQSIQANEQVLQSQRNQLDQLQRDLESQRIEADRLRQQRLDDEAALKALEKAKAELEAKVDNDGPVKTVGGGRDINVLKIFGIVSSLLSLVTAGLLGFILLNGGIGKGSEPDPNETDVPTVFEGEGTMDINGTEYKVPLSNIVIENGQTKTVFYAVQTSLSENGDVTADAYPIGAWVFKSADVTMSPDETPAPAEGNGN